MAALALWRWDDPNRAEAAAYALAVQPRSLPANFTADLITTSPKPGLGLVDARTDNHTPIA